MKLKDRSQAVEFGLSSSVDGLCFLCCRVSQLQPLTWPYPRGFYSSSYRPWPPKAWHFIPQVSGRERERERERDRDRELNECIIFSVKLKLVNLFFAGNGQFIIQALPQQAPGQQMAAPQLQQVTISQASIPTMIQQPQGQQQVRNPHNTPPVTTSRDTGITAFHDWFNFGFFCP